MTKMPRNTKILCVLLVAGIAMGIVAYASVPLYRMFCSATGYNGTTQRAEANPDKAIDRWVTVSFDTNVDPNLPWDFKPDQKSIKVKLGETANVTFHARNRSDKTIVGEATFNVQPDKAGSYFNKIQCFCFEKQTLAPGETQTMPVQFYVDPDMAKDKNTFDVQDITLSYTFFKAKNQDIIAQPKKQSGKPS